MSFWHQPRPPEEADRASYTWMDRNYGNGSMNNTLEHEVSRPNPVRSRVSSADIWKAGLNMEGSYGKPLEPLQFVELVVCPPAAIFAADEAAAQFEWMDSDFTSSYAEMEQRSSAISRQISVVPVSACSLAGPKRRQLWDPGGRIWDPGGTSCSPRVDADERVESKLPSWCVSDWAPTAVNRDSNSAAECSERESVDSCPVAVDDVSSRCGIENCSRIEFEVSHATLSMTVQMLRAGSRREAITTTMQASNWWSQQVEKQRTARESWSRSHQEASTTVTRSRGGYQQETISTIVILHDMRFMQAAEASTVRASRSTFQHATSLMTATILSLRTQQAARSTTVLVSRSTMSYY